MTGLDGMEDGEEFPLLHMGPDEADIDRAKLSHHVETMMAEWSPKSIEQYGTMGTSEKRKVYKRKMRGEKGERI